MRRPVWGGGFFFGGGGAPSPQPGGVFGGRPRGGGGRRATLGCRVLLEMGPQPMLSAMALRAWPDGRATPTAIASLRREIPDARQITEALAQLYVAGSRPAFAALGAARTGHPVDLP